MQSLQKKLLFFLTFIVTISFAQRGKNGNVTINTANKIVNEYTTLTADAAAGDTLLTVTASGLNANNRFSTSLAPGDLIMIIQMQGITPNGFFTEFPAGSGSLYGQPYNNTWGAINSYNNCGNYEFCEVKSVASPSTTKIIIDCGLKYSYISAGRVQIVRVPRYNSLTVSSPGTISCTAWATGGIYFGGVIAIEVKGNTTINAGASISAKSLGFRGGITDATQGLGGGQISRTDAAEGAEKGEGVLGYQADYNVIGGRYCRGVAGNGGGGADCHNAGGGGGSNAGDINTWDGEGNPDISVAGWSSAWNLETMASFATHTSSGGGRGGYSFASLNKDATTDGPYVSGGTNDWGGDLRRNNGGWGGRPLDYSTGKLFLGGGGGAGDQDNSVGGAGGKGGGLIYLLSYGNIGGTGSFIADGANGSNSGIDGAGGAGGGGTIILNALGTISGITATANGGNGGNQSVSAFNSESEGPGGSGGGGYISISNGAITKNVLPGVNGTTNSSSLSEFPPNGATNGAAGISNQIITNPDTIVVTDVVICSGTSATLTASLFGSIPATIMWYSTQTGGTALGSGSTFTTPVLNTNTTYYVGFCPGTYRTPVNVSMQTSTTPITGFSYPTSPVCANGANPTPSAVVNQTAGGVYSSTSGLTINAGTGVINLSTSTPGAYEVTYTITGAGCAGSGFSTDSIIINPINTPVTNFSYASPVCATGTANPNTITGFTTGGIYSSDNGLVINQSTGVINLATSTTGSHSIKYVVAATSCGPADSTTASITINPTTTPVTGITYPVFVCVNGTNPAPVTAAGFTSGGVYSSTAGLTINSTTGLIDLATSTPASYNVTYTVSASGCMLAGSSSDSITIKPVTAPQTGFSYTSPVCANGTDAPSGVPGFTAGGVYTSAVGLAINSSTGIIDLSASTPNSYTIKYVVAANGCAPADSSIAAITITPLSTPVTSFSYPSAMVCMNENNPIPSLGSGSAVGGTYSSTAGLTIDPSTGEIDLPTSTSNTYVVTYSITANGCEAAGSSTFSITLNSVVTPVTTFSYASPFCANGVNPLPTLVSGFTTGGSFGSLSAGLSIDPATGLINLAASAPGNYVVAYLPPQTACTQQVPGTFAITINTLPTPGITSNIASGCAPLCVQFNETASATCSSLLYNFGDGNTASSSAPLHCYTASGSYSVTIACTDANNCVGTTVVNNMILISPVLVASFSISPTDIIIPNTTINFSNTSSGATTQSWDFGDPASTVNNSSSSASPGHTYSTEGNYCVTLSTANSGGCTDTSIKCITVVNDATIDIPNVFTPNGDGKNDVFMISTSSMKELTCSIFDRWGLKVAEWNTINGGWDGRTNNSNIATDGVYYYVLKATALNDKQFERKGFFQMIKGE